jgi:hypothetical protein
VVGLHSPGSHDLSSGVSGFDPALPPGMSESVSPTGDAGGHWGHMSHDKSMGTSVLDCPTSILTMTCQFKERP